MWSSVKLLSALAALWVTVASADPQTQPAGGVQTRPAAEPRSRYARDVSYLTALNDLSEDERKAKGRQRAERDYAAGWGELDLYGFRLFWSGAHVDQETGLYPNLTGCCVRHEDEIEAYNERLRELTRKKGLPANAKLLREQIKCAEQFLKKSPKLDWTRVPPFEGKIGEWLEVGPYKVRWEFTVFDFTPEKRKYVYLRLTGGSELVEIHVDDELPPLRVAYWAERNLLVLDMGEGKKVTFWDLSYSRVVYEYDAEAETHRAIWREQEKLRLQNQPATQPCIVS